jgi:hypothetical protein
MSIKNLELPGSPKEYKTQRKILQELISESEISKYDPLPKTKKLDLIPLQSLDFLKDLKLDVIINAYPKENNVLYDLYNKEFKSFLCELELFNWKNLKEENKEIPPKDSNIGIYLRLVEKYSIYTSYLCKKLGNDLTVFSFGHTKVDVKELIKKIVPFSKYSNTPFFSKNRYKILSNLGCAPYNNEEMLFNSMLFVKKEKNLYMVYSDQILRKNNKSRYDVINIGSQYGPDNSGHYTFLFVDHHEKSLEYYDSNGGTSKNIPTDFVYKTFEELYPGYKINEFWKHEGIQQVEGIEQDEEGFCVTWGHMMLHLKLLNINIPIGQIEKLFIKECYDKKLSLYEVMLNYVYYMTRIVSIDNNKAFKLDELLKTYVK